MDRVDVTSLRANIEELRAIRVRQTAGSARGVCACVYVYEHKYVCACVQYIDVL